MRAKQCLVLIFPFPWQRLLAEVADVAAGAQETAADTQPPHGRHQCQAGRSADDDARLQAQEDDQDSGQWRYAACQPCGWRGQGQAQVECDEAGRDDAAGLAILEGSQRCPGIGQCCLGGTSESLADAAFDLQATTGQRQ